MHVSAFYKRYWKIISIHTIYASTNYYNFIPEEQNQNKKRSETWPISPNQLVICEKQIYVMYNMETLFINEIN